MRSSLPRAYLRCDSGWRGWLTLRNFALIHDEEERLRGVSIAAIGRLRLALHAEAVEGAVTEA